MKTTVRLQPSPEVMEAIKLDFETLHDKNEIAKTHGISIYHLNKLFPEYKKNYKLKQQKSGE